MSRCYTDRVEVLRRNDEPAHFLWRSRLYVVRGVLAHWVETGDWWRRSLSGADAVAGAEAGSDGAALRVGVDTAGTARRTVGAGRRVMSREGDPDGGRSGGVGTVVAPERASAAGLPEAGQDVSDDPVNGEDAEAEPTSDEEREIWRVEACAGRCGTPGVYDLCFAWSSGAWTLMRAGDGVTGDDEL